MEKIGTMCDTAADDLSRWDREEEEDSLIFMPSLIRIIPHVIHCHSNAFEFYELSKNDVYPLLTNKLLFSKCRLQITLYCAVLCHIVSSLHRLAGLFCRIFLSYGLQVLIREVHRSS